MTVLDRIESDYKDAFKRHDTVAVEAFRMLKSALKNAEIEARHPLDEAAMIAVIGREAKRRRESIQMFTSAGRQDLADHESAQIKFVEQYLPAQLSDNDLEPVVIATIAEMNATPKEFGKVMSAVMAKVTGQADGTRVSALVKKNLK